MFFLWQKIRNITEKFLLKLSRLKISFTINSFYFLHFFIFQNSPVNFNVKKLLNLTCLLWLMILFQLISFYLMFNGFRIIWCTSFFHLFFDGVWKIMFFDRNKILFLLNSVFHFMGWIIFFVKHLYRVIL